MRGLACVFADVPIGTVCTGTVHMFKLPVGRLLELGAIRAEGADYIFCGLRWLQAEGSQS